MIRSKNKQKRKNRKNCKLQKISGSGKDEETSQYPRVDRKRLLLLFVFNVVYIWVSVRAVCINKIKTLVLPRSYTGKTMPVHFSPVVTFSLPHRPRHRAVPSIWWVVPTRWHCMAWSLSRSGCRKLTCKKSLIEEKHIAQTNLQIKF